MAAASGLAGALIGYFQTAGNGAEAWADWREELRLAHVREFAVVAYLHAAGYAGAVLGLGVGIGYLFKHRNERSL